MVEYFFCCPLACAAKFFGWLGGISSALLCIFCAICLGRVHEIIASEYYRKYIRAEYSEEALTIIIALYMVLFIISTVTHICLVVGTMKRKHNLLLPWTIETLFNLGLTLLLYLRDAQFSWISLIVLVLNLYFWYAMVSLYGKIREGNERRSNRNVNV
ncbi:uncharacterized protein LOC126756991 [Bactrocera neohumeralis]|uniref:uncharacterized protein LOC126756991 n=1 Tax=Bactrocera neohumeralis TaxID=98809 RepID=UPI0021659377|nr:uncharacterized protein LOC126756991 [Bactrocera neohumeralis]